ncbi:hypothetical protein [Psychroflexus lacisalsi]|jgi:hypothetical protein|uniref:Uncharacterized protein n=1 Tax=Psychroflexus lacisalsi TaxID=503928 RepID=A0ABN1KA19_9FLAO|nr:hypothetical protein [Psychroflexus lacisalsi]MBZ9619946.1 hypothetical protein [Psychroflexus lacisalsi]
MNLTDLGQSRIGNLPLFLEEKKKEMNAFGKRPKGNFISEANWQGLYVLTEHWKSDVSFYSEDLNFLHHLIDKYFLKISKRENIDKVLEIEINLLKVDKQCVSLLSKINQHLHHLAELIDDSSTLDSHQFRLEHEGLEDNFAQFVKDFRNQRREVFKITEYLITGEDLVKQLSINSQ